MKYVITIIIQVLCHFRLQLYVSIYYSVLSFIECKLTLIGVAESNCGCWSFFLGGGELLWCVVDGWCGHGGLGGGERAVGMVN